MHKRYSLFAVRLSVFYGVCAAFWVFITDLALRRLIPDPEFGLILQTYKGWIFVLLTSCLLFAALRAQLRKWEQTLRGSEQRYQELMEQAADAIHLLDKNGNFLLVNSRMAGMLGYPAEQLLRMNIVDTYPPELRAEGRRRLSEVTEGRMMRFERLAMRKDGTTFPVESNVMALADGTFQGITRDMTEHRKAEDALARSESLYRTIFQRANVSLWEEDISELRTAVEGLASGGVTDFRAYFETHPEFLAAAARMTRVVDVNEATLRLYEANDKAELIGPLDSTFRLDTAVTRPSWIENLTAIAEGREYFEMESAAKTCRGKLINIVVSSYIPLRSAPYPYMLISVTDITARKQAEDRLHDNERLLRQVIDLVPHFIFARDADGRLLLANRACAEGTDGNPGLVGGPCDLSKIADPLQAQAFRRDDLEVISGGRQIQVQEQWTDARGMMRVLQTTRMPFAAPRTRAPAVLGTSVDITDLKRAENALRTSEESLRALLNASMDVAFLMRVDGTLLACNDAFARKLSAQPAELVGKPLTEVANEEIRGGRGAHAEAVVRSGKAARFEDTRDGHIYDHSVVPMVEPSGAVSHLAWFVRDITEPRRLEEQLRQAQKLESIGRLSGGIAHDFNNILQVISGYGEVLRTELPAGSPLRESVATIAHAAQKAAALVAQLMVFSRKQALQPRVLDTTRLVRSMEKMLERVIGEDIELATTVDPRTGNFRADAGQLEQVLLNLAVNARDAMPGGGRLEIETANQAFDAEYVRAHPEMKAGTYVRIIVRDTGIGMDEETVSHIYEPFFTTKRPDKGTGLGLSMVYGIIKQSEGHIICSSAPGKGTAFTMYFPVVQEKAAESGEASPGAATRGRETILLVEDDEGVRRLARQVLERGGYTVIEAPGGPEALSELSLKRGGVRLLLTDIVMPRMNGRELARRLTAEFPDLRVVFASGYAEDRAQNEDTREPRFDFIQKPFSSQELLQKVREVLDRP
jgi:two-component system cell cycle sensor histidine kinase/response regulator CckA